MRLTWRDRFSIDDGRNLQCALFSEWTGEALQNESPDVWKHAPMVAAHLAHACLTLLLLDAVSPEARDPMGTGLQRGLSGFPLVSTFVVA
jgi:hypothetical protein